MCHESFLACFSGYYLAAGFTDGSVHILDAISLQSSCKEFKFSHGPVTHISFSHDSEYLATAVSLFFSSQQFMCAARGAAFGGNGKCWSSCEVQQSERCEGCPSLGAL